MASRWTRTAQVEVAVLEARLLADGDVLVDRERRGRGLVEDDHVVHVDLDLAGRQVGVGRALGAQAHLARHLHDVLGAQRVRDLLAQHHLGKARSVAQVDERDPAVIARRPTQPESVTVAPASAARRFPARWVRSTIGLSLKRGRSRGAARRQGARASLAADDARLEVVGGRRPGVGVGGNLVTRADVLDLAVARPRLGTTRTGFPGGRRTGSACRTWRRWATPRTAIPRARSASAIAVRDAAACPRRSRPPARRSARPRVATSSPRDTSRDTSR